MNTIAAEYYIVDNTHDFYAGDALTNRLDLDIVLRISKISDR